MDRTGRVGQDQALDSGTGEEPNPGGDFMRAVTFVKMHPALREDDRRAADFAQARNGSGDLRPGSAAVRPSRSTE